MPRNGAAPGSRKNQESHEGPENGNEAVGQAVDDVDKIRDIIFGGQMREYANRFEQLETRVSATIDRLSQDIEKQFEQLTHRLAAETKERKDADSATYEKLQDSAELSTTKVTETNSRVTAEVEQLLAALAAERQALNTVIEEAKDELSTRLTTEMAQIQQRKLDSTELAQLFTDVAHALKQSTD